MTSIKLPLLLGSALSLVCLASPALGQGMKPDKESVCDDRIDEDGDSVTDCADADCYDDPVCKSAGGLENSDVLCTDFVDNDGDGAVDCEDIDCQRQGLTACQGSWKGPLTGTGSAPPPPTGGEPSGGQTSAGGAPSGTGMPELAEGQSFEDILGTGGDADGERNDYVCSDGYDNDGDGRVDCQDLGCQFDPNVTVCRGTPGLRFSVAGHVRTSYDFEAGEDDVDSQPWDTRVNRLQLRAFGPIPTIQDSFFLISIRAEQAPRLTFAFFAMPLGGGHFVNINSGGGSLSNLPVLSVSKNPLLDGAFYLTNAFEQGNGAALEFYGPIIPGTLDYRVFAAGGSGRFNGNIGGRFFNSDDRNYTWGAGGQLAYYVFGRFDRWDTRFLYTPVSKAMTLYVGGRYDQREFERYPWVNANLLLRWGRFLTSVEGNYKREINFDTNQIAWNVTLGFLAWSKNIYLTADVGQFAASSFQNLASEGIDPTNLPTDLRRIENEFQYRFAAHYYAWRNQGLITLLYTDGVRSQDNIGLEEDVRTRELRVEAQFRF